MSQRTVSKATQGIIYLRRDISLPESGSYTRYFISYETKISAIQLEILTSGSNHPIYLILSPSVYPFLDLFPYQSDIVRDDGGICQGIRLILVYFLAEQGTGQVVLGAFVVGCV